MTELNNDLYLKEDEEQDLERSEDLGNHLISQSCNTKMRDAISLHTNYMSNIKDEIFMQLQTELFDILLEIYNITPTWGSFKENFYFHWKRIIGACNFKDLHAYRLIFRCLGNLRPSSMPLFILRPVIKQLDEYRKISEPEYCPTNFELSPSIHGNIVTCSNTPIVMVQNTHATNKNSALVEDKNEKLIENKRGKDLSPDKCNSNTFYGINQITKNSGFSKTGLNEMCGTPLLLFENDINSSASLQNNKSNIFDSICSSLNKNLFFPSIRQQDVFKNVNEKSFEEIKQKNEILNKEDTFPDDCSINDVSKPFIVSNYCNSNSTASSPYGSTCTTSSLSSTEYNIAGPIMAAFQHIQAVAVAAAVANDPKNKINSINNLSIERDTLQPKKRPRRNGEIQGVYFDKIRKLWRANWKENGRVKTKGFSVFQFGDDGARQRAIEYRKKMEKEFYIIPHSKLSKNSSNEESVYIDSGEALQKSVSPIKKYTERNSDLNNILSGQELSSDNTKLSENSNSNLNN